MVLKKNNIEKKLIKSWNFAKKGINTIDTIITIKIQKN